MRRFLLFLLRALHGLTWLFVVVLVLLFILLVVAACGIPGSWLQSYLDDMVSPEVGTLTVERISYLPIRGLTIKGMALKSQDGELLVGMSRSNFEFPLFSLRSFADRLKSVTIEDLYVAIPQELSPDDIEFDFSTLELPQLKDVQLTLVRPNIIEVTAESAIAQVSVEGQRLLAKDITVQVSQQGEMVEGTVIADFQQQVVDLSLRGHAYQTRINGIWRALNLDIVRHYSDNFHLNAPAWGDMEIRVGLNPRHDIFHLEGDIVALAGGNYCGVPFDEGITHVVSDNVYDTHTVFSGIKAYRDNELLGTGMLTFDVGSETFEFEVESERLSPVECLQIIDEPFTDRIPEIVATVPPKLKLRGTLPLYRVQEMSEKIYLDGEIIFPEGGTCLGLKTTYIESELRMGNNVISLKDTTVRFPSGDGEVNGNASFALSPAADFMDVSVATHLKNVSILDIAKPFSRSENIPDAMVNGFVDISCRTDETIKSSLHGDFNLLVEGEILTRAQIFSVLTDVLADYVPGVSSITDVSQAKVNGSIDNGVLLVPDFELTGDLLSVEGTIAFNIPQDTVYAELSAGNFKRGSVLGYLTRWATKPVNSLVWQIRLSGPRDDIEWTIHTFVNRIWDSTLGDDTTPLTPKTEDEDEGGLFDGVLSIFGLGDDEEDEPEAEAVEEETSTLSPESNVSTAEESL